MPPTWRPAEVAAAAASRKSGAAELVQEIFGDLARVARFEMQNISTYDPSQSHHTLELSCPKHTGLGQK